MGRLVKNSLPAERKRFLSYSETFENAVAVEQNGGSINGAPKIEIGAVFDGTNDYIEYDFTDSELSGGSLSFLIRFRPDFAFDDGVSHYIISSTSEDYRVWKTSSDRLQITLGNILIANVIIDSSWIQGTENRLVITSVSGDTSVWLNGSQVLANDVSAWSPAAISNFYIGAASNGAVKFDGEISEVKIFKTQLGDDEALQLSTSDWTTYRNQAVLDLQTDFLRHDPTNSQTLDISENGLNGGFTGSNLTKNSNKLGYNFPGTDEFLDVGDTSQNIKTVAFLCNPGSTTENMMDLDAGTHTIEVGTGTITATGFVSPTIYVDGEVSSALDSGRYQLIVVTTDTAIDTDDLDIGRIAASYYTGDLAKIAMWTTVLSALQIQDLYLRVKKQINDL